MRKTKPKRHRQFKAPAPRVFLVTTQRFAWLLLAISTLALLIWLFYSDIFHIKRTLCIQEERPCSIAVEAELKNFVGTSILTFRADQLEAKLKSANIDVEDVKIKIQLPNTISVTLTSRQSSISLAPKTGSAILLVNQDYTPFKLSDKDKNPPQILTSKFNDLTLGEQINDPIIVSSINLVQALKSNFISFKYVEIIDNRLQVVLKNNTLAIFGSQDDFVSSVPSLHFILSQAKIGEKPKKIDLRFAKPVLQF